MMYSSTDVYDIDLKCLAGSIKSTR